MFILTTTNGDSYGVAMLCGLCSGMCRRMRCIVLHQWGNRYGCSRPGSNGIWNRSSS